MRSISILCLLTTSCLNPDYSAQSNLNPCSSAPDECPSGEVCARGFCTPNLDPTPLADIGLGADVVWSSDIGSTAQDAGSSDTGTRAFESCQALAQSDPNASSGTYIIDPDGQESGEPFEVFCDMERAGGGWTQVIRVQNGASSWNAWTDFRSESNAWGAPIRLFATSPEGEELEYMLVEDDQLAPYRYRGVRGNYAWKHDHETYGRVWDEAFEFSPVASDDFSLCTSGLQHPNSGWIWSLGSSGGVGCSAVNDKGFSVHAAPNQDDIIGTLYSPPEPGGVWRDAVRDWATLKVFLRRSTLSPQPALDAGPMDAGVTTDLGGAAPDAAPRDAAVPEAGAGDAGPPGCGNGVTEQTEQCDDGNLVNNDGCTDACRWNTDNRPLDCAGTHGDSKTFTYNGNLYWVCHTDPDLGDGQPWRSWHGWGVACRRWGGYLVTLTDQAERDAVFAQTNPHRYWTGAQRHGQTWSWRNGEPNNGFDPWTRGFENQNGCAATRGAAELYGADCAQLFGGVCEFRPSRQPGPEPANQLGHNMPSCKQIKEEDPLAPSGYYWIDPNENGQSIRVYCDHENAQGGWTRAVRVHLNQVLWNVWNTNVQPQRSDLPLDAAPQDSAFGLALQQFSRQPDGEDLSYRFVIDGTAHRTMYRQVDGAVWDNTQPAGVYDDDGFSYSLDGGTWQQCSTPLQHLSGHTNWGIVGNDQDPACGGWQETEAGDRHGIIVHGDPNRPGDGSEHATIIMTGPAYYRNWSKLEIFVR